MTGRTWRGLWLCALMTMLAAGAVQAQVQGPGATVVALPRTDAWLGAGWFNHQADCVGGCPWMNRSVWVGVGAGYYWTEHHKTEVDLGATSEGRTYFYGSLEQVNGIPYNSYGDLTVATRRLSVMQLYQFRHNAWIHPFVGAGVHVVRESRTEVRYRYPAYGSGGPETMVTREATETRLRPALMAGLKGYLTPRTFARTDITAGFRDRLDEVTVRVGIGIDF